MAQAIVDEPQTETLALVSAGRLHDPMLVTASQRPAEGTRGRAIRTLHEYSEDARLPSLLAEALRSQLAWNSLSQEETDRARLVEAYTESLKQIMQFRKDVERVVHYACLANLEFRQSTGETNIEARQEAMDAKLTEMLAEASSHWPLIDNALEVNLVSKRATTLREHLHQSLTKTTNDFSSHFFELLARLVDRRMFGLVEWWPNHCCKYHFFKRIVAQEIGQTTRKVTETRFDEILDTDSNFWNRVVGRRTTVDTRTGKHIHLFARHEHSVINAVRTSIGNSQVVMPPAVTELTRQIPGWLYPFVTVIDGTIFKELIVEREVGAEDFAQVTVRDEPIFGCEPAVLIGKYVLTGWGPTEVAQEQQRREAEEREVAAKQEQESITILAPVFAVLGVGLIAVALFLFGRSLSGAGGGLFAMIAAGAAVLAIWQAVYDMARAQQRATPELMAHWAAGGATFTVLSLGWFVARWFQPLSWIPLIVFSVTLGVCIWRLRRFFPDG